MDRKRLKFLVLGTGILVSMALLLVAAMGQPGSFAYYLTVSEFLASPDRDEDAFRVNGKVLEGTIERLSSGREVAFRMSDGAATLAVRYQGIIPDTFVDRADVVVEGRLQEDGEFVAHTLLAKCPSKYEAAEGYEAGAYEAGAAPSIAGSE